ncbi:class I SAM-dependent methyltransferase [Marinospirillum sp.]|uniref:class I SAM-dependent methyltransferase n=1 Tax=Marinospirillum sp. TaxID=2183934 RepID=UPI00384C8315
MLVCKQPSAFPQAHVWSEQLQLPLLENNPASGFYLLYDQQGLALANADDPKVLPVRVDFLSGATAHRRIYGGGRGQALAKACGLKPGITPRILDATAGLAGDAFVLASLGCDLLAIERHPWIAALVEDALQRSAPDPEVAEVTARLKMRKGDATCELDRLARREDFAPQVVYLDPMFPHTEKTAQVKKEMQFFRELVGKDEDADLLLDQALNLASHRVVVKRPRKAPPLAGKEPGLVLSGKANRFDIYPLKSLRE